MQTVSALPPNVLMLQIIKALLIVGLVAYLFYQSIIAAILLIPLGYMIVYRGALDYQDSTKRKVELQFKEGIGALSGALSTGYSLENAFGEARDELELLYGKEAVIVKEFGTVTNKISLNRNIEDAITELSEGIDSEDARNFAAVFRYAKRSGGDLIKIIKEAADNIEAKQRVKEEIEVMIAAKRFEQKIMNIIPFAIILYINATMPGMLDNLYHNLLGIIIMSVMLMLYGAAILLSDRIMDIEV